ncbi:TrkA C-terminal domain-containing protein [Variovorax sp. J22R133]|uniref:aspartate:alanine exchanger family transporter n=1 Tax=Variovorax brevis TaxID=3053503 RepID=UPI002576D418|nr:TrkA C-terminal domain-containing protein [Variovorax sp. J22R133]MDM0111462.1 TrkA C-terminal domain-containing protein [Variovorax sp. J22R133]
MTAISTFLTAQPLLAVFLTIALGYLLGAVNLGGFSLGSGAVLFVGLAVGAWAPKLVLPALVGNLGLLLFLYGVGIAYGAQFFRGLSSAEGAKANLAAAIAVAAALGVTLAAVQWIPGVELPEALGAFAGAGTSTAALQAALAVFGTTPATGYSVAYPLGVFVPILLLGLYSNMAKPKLEKRGAAAMQTAEAEVTEFSVLGMTLGHASRNLPAGVAIVAIRRGHHNLPAADDTALERGDVVLLTGTDQAALVNAASRFGPANPGRMLRDRSDMDYRRFFISNPKVAGQRLGDVELPPELGARVLHLRRSDADMPPDPDRLLEFGDRVGVLAPRESFAALGKIFGDSVRSTAEVSYIAIGVGVTLGLAFGAIPWPVPVIGRLSLGFAGLLLVALFLGWCRRTGPFQWAIPMSANLVLRNFGLTLFLAVVGISSGATFAAAIAKSGLLYVLLGSAIVAVIVVVTLLITLFVFRLPFDAAAGIVCGATGNPAILAFSNRIAPTDRPDIGYAMIFPSMTVLKILLVQIVSLWGK